MADADFTSFKILSICKGGGYEYCRTSPPHPRRNSNGLYPLHRVLAENKIGRLLKAGEHVHHIDEDKSNNDPSNLEVMTISEHAKHHASGAELVEIVCPCCNKSFMLKPHQYRLRKARNKSSRLYCSRSCAVKAQHIAS